MKITNISQGPRGVNSIEGPVLIEPGQEADVEIYEREFAVARKTKWFSFEKDAKAVPNPPEPKKD